MLNSLLANDGQWVSYVILGVLIVAIVVMFIFSGRRRKKQEEEAKNLIDAVKPGNKVKTIGGICGIVVEVDVEENTFVLETGTEQSGKCFIKFDRQAIYQTDAVVKKDENKEEVKEETEAPATGDVQEVSTSETPETLKEEVETKVEEKSSEEKKD